MLITAEIGINHQGKLDTAIDMIGRAKEAGADIVKFQKRDVDRVYTPEDLATPCKSPWGGTVEDKVRGRELSWDDYVEIAGVCAKEKVGWAASCWDVGSLVQLEKLFGGEIAYHKVAAALTGNEAFLSTVAAFGRLTVISTGLCRDLFDVRRVASLFESRGCPYVLLHSTPHYPTPHRLLNLAIIGELIREFHSWPSCRGVGYSGHESGFWPTLQAAAYGATYIERHFTLDRQAYGADQGCSLEEGEYLEMTSQLRLVSTVQGSRHKGLDGTEKRPQTGMGKV